VTQQKWLLDGPKIIDIDVVRTLKVGLVAGQVDIVGHDEPTARIEVHSVSGKELKLSISDGVLEIDHPQLGWENWTEVFKFWRGSASADVSILVPRHVELRLGVVSASAVVSGIEAEVSLSSVSGEVVVDGVSGDAALNSVSGELAVRNHYGAITAHSVSGDIAAAGELFGFTADTVSGAVFVDSTGSPDRMRVNTVSGTVTVRLAPELPVQYRISTVSGKLQLDDASVTGVRGAYNGKYGDLTGGRYLAFTANTVSGDVSVLHAVSA
jgi:hypothetical protein